MTHQFSPAVERIINAKMATGRYENEDELVMAALASLDAEEDDLEAIQAGLDVLDRGDVGIPVAEAFRRLREKYDIKDDS